MSGEMRREKESLGTKATDIPSSGVVSSGFQTIQNTARESKMSNQRSTN
jgi:hypothetical protein